MSRSLWVKRCPYGGFDEKMTGNDQIIQTKCYKSMHKTQNCHFFEDFVKKCVFWWFWLQPDGTVRGINQLFLKMKHCFSLEICARIIKLSCFFTWTLGFFMRSLILLTFCYVFLSFGERLRNSLKNLKNRTCANAISHITQLPEKMWPKMSTQKKFIWNRCFESIFDSYFR